MSFATFYDDRGKTSKTQYIFKRLVLIDREMNAQQDPQRLSRIRRPRLSSLGRGLRRVTDTQTSRAGYENRDHISLTNRT